MVINNIYMYLRTKVLRGCCKPVFITLRLYTNLTLPVIDFPFDKEISSDKILEKTFTHYDVNVNRYDLSINVNADVICQVRATKCLTAKVLCSAIIKL